MDDEEKVFHFDATFIEIHMGIEINSFIIFSIRTRHRLLYFGDFVHNFDCSKVYDI